MSKQLSLDPRVRKLLRKGIDHHQAGRLKPAETCYQRSLKFDPRCAQALHLLGLLAQQSGRYPESVCLIGQALALNPEDPDALNSLGDSYLGEGRIEAAISCLERVTSLVPGSATAHHRLGKAQERVGNWVEAGTAYRRALALEPGSTDVRRSLVGLLCKQESYSEAAEYCRRALDAHPNDLVLHHQLGEALAGLGNYDGAKEVYRRAREFEPNCALTADGLGYVFERSGDLNAASDCYREALRLDAKLAVARIHLGNVYAQEGKMEKAAACFEQVREVEPENPDARSALALLYLRRGDFAVGWHEYEYRWKTVYGLRQNRKFAQPLWRGEPLQGQRILLHAEQGLGDTLQFVRFVPLVAARGGRVILEVPLRSFRLLASTGGAEKVISRGETLPDFDWQCPLMSLPLALGTQPGTIPAVVPYLHPDPTQVDLWRLRLQGQPLRVGLAWAGNAQHPYDRWRSIPLQQLAPLTHVEGVKFYSLQMGPPARQIAETGFGLDLVDLQNEQHDFADTAAIVSNLDLVISVDTAMAHLAGLLAKPVWILLQKTADWRWLLDREDSPWYPTARLFRQSALGNWQDVVARVERELRALVSGAPAAEIKTTPVNPVASPPAVIDVIRFLQTQTGTKCRPPQAGDRIGFVFSSKNRVSFTRQALRAMDTDGGYDLIWNDGSDEPAARALPESFHFHQARLVEVNHGVGGGPDRSICFGLERLLKLGYDYVGLMENDIVLQPGWFGRLLNLFELAAADGVVCGAATVRSYESRVIEHRAGYSINWGTGAGMILFSRSAAEVILGEYAKLRMATDSIARFYSRLFGIDLRLQTRDSTGRLVQGSAWLTRDWGYTPMLFLHGYTSVGSIPSLASDLEFPPGHFLLNDYVRPERFNAGVVVARTSDP